MTREERSKHAMLVLANECGLTALQGILYIHTPVTFRRKLNANYQEERILKEMPGFIEPWLFGQFVTVMSNTANPVRQYEDLLPLSHIIMNECTFELNTPLWQAFKAETGGAVVLHIETTMKDCYQRIGKVLVESVKDTESGELLVTEDKVRLLGMGIEVMIILYWMFTDDEVIEPYITYLRGIQQLKLQDSRMNLFLASRYWSPCESCLDVGDALQSMMDRQQSKGYRGVFPKLSTEEEVAMALITVEHDSPADPYTFGNFYKALKKDIQASIEKHKELKHKADTLQKNPMSNIQPLTDTEMAIIDGISIQSALPPPDEIMEAAREAQKAQPEPQKAQPEPEPQPQPEPGPQEAQPEPPGAEEGVPPV
jgi:hypothetical protein